MRGAGGSDPGTPAGSHRSSGNTPPIAPAANARAPRPRNPTARAPDFGLTFPDTCVCLLRRLGVTSHPRRRRCSAPAHLSPGRGRGLGWETGRAVSVRPGARCPVFSVAEPVCTQALWSVKSGRPLRRRGAGPGRCSHLDGASPSRRPAAGSRPSDRLVMGAPLPLVAEPPAALGTRSAQGPPLLRAALPVTCLVPAGLPLPGWSCPRALLPPSYPPPSRGRRPGPCRSRPARRCAGGAGDAPSARPARPASREALAPGGCRGRRAGGAAWSWFRAQVPGPLGCYKPRPTRSPGGSWAEQAGGVPAGPGQVRLKDTWCCSPHALQAGLGQPQPPVCKRIRSLAVFPTVVSLAVVGGERHEDLWCRDHPAPRTEWTEGGTWVGSARVLGWRRPGTPEATVLGELREGYLGPLCSSKLYMKIELPENVCVF